MIAIFLLIILSILIAVGFLASFIWSVRTGQYEDTCTPSMRLLTEDPVRCNATAKVSLPNHNEP